MNPQRHLPTAAWRRVLGALLVALGAHAGALAQDANALRARHDSLRDSLATSPFQRPLVLESSEASDALKGQVYAVVAQPFSVVGPALQGVDQWCEVMFLHLNVKSCSFAGKPPNEVLSLVAGSKSDRAFGDTYTLEFAYRVPVASRDYLRVQMDAATGPLDTRNYRLVLEAIALDAGRSFISLSYAYVYGTAARLATQAYLATLGRDKVGFSITGKTSGGAPVYIKGIRGVAERNTMRYFLAVEVYLGALALPPAERQDRRLRDWFDATERYPLQLHELEREDYLAMKRRGVVR